MLVMVLGMLSYDVKAGAERSQAIAQMSSEGSWVSYTNGNEVWGLAIDGDYLWAATGILMHLSPFSENVIRKYGRFAL
jgi:hypothetical protein